MRLHIVSDKERISFTSTIATKKITIIIKLFFCLGDKDGKLCNRTLDFEEQWLFYAPPRFMLNKSYVLPTQYIYLSQKKRLLFS
jgi:hypothetical protein